jgi:hypothetical protein
MGLRKQLSGLGRRLQAQLLLLVYALALLKEELIEGGGHRAELRFQLTRLFVVIGAHGRGDLRAVLQRLHRAIGFRDGRVHLVEGGGARRPGRVLTVFITGAAAARGTKRSGAKTNARRRRFPIDFLPGLWMRFLSITKLCRE